MKKPGGFLLPEEIIKKLNIKEDMIIADFGCGSGYFVIPLAKIVEKGKVFALDVLPEALESVRSRAKLEGLFNIETKHCDLENENGSGLEDDSIDIVLLANILFQVEEKSAIIKEAERLLKGGGKLIIVDWKPNQPMGPSSDLIVSIEFAKEVAEKIGLIFNKEFPVDEYHWGIVLNK